MRRVDTVLGGVLKLLGVDPINQFRERGDHQTYAADLLTRPDYQENCDNFLADMPLRFHQRTVHRDLPDDTGAATDIAQFVALGTIRNVRRVPVLLLSVESILETLRRGSPDETDQTFVRARRAGRSLELLRRDKYSKVIPRVILTTVASTETNTSAARAILGTLNGQSIMSFDPAFVWPQVGIIMKELLSLRFWTYERRSKWRRSTGVWFTASNSAGTIS